MRLPEPQRLPSGNWRIQLQIKGHRYSITAPTKKEVRDKAKQIFAGVEMEKRLPMTVGRAMDQYIAEKSGILSPSTIRGYNSYRRNYFQDLMDMNISDLTQGDIQLAVSNEALKGKSPKTIRKGDVTSRDGIRRADLIRNITMIEECANSIDRNLLRFVTVEGSSLPPELWYQQRIFFWKLSQMRG